ncbi:MAG: arginine deiminase family protein [Bacteroidetes bacterium]|nr:arginine deiminase family protein [Rhodothermia bacterium]MCS7154971.1 arginine deiminase family protein [Bacteroidota bacterium]MCX7907255.1 arginine deiminase family protein [Bacteroidota bacterium]MDW8138019.1 arginine deiminase family protein [Bacteroidota bacterium]MDW8286129.1 arginine deiminase family protein [Bacteroidota bacterium]
MRVYRSAAEIDFHLTDLPRRAEPGRVLMVRPDYFEVAYVINPHMQGQLGKVDRARALEQWEALRAAYERLGFSVVVLEPVPGLPDMVFAANQSLPFQSPEGRRRVWMSRMHAPQRRPEVPHIEAWYRSEGYEVDHFSDPEVSDFEGMGDAIWHPGRMLLWGGYGFRSSLRAYEEISRRWGVPVVALELRDPDFYHLDTCFCVLDEETVLLYPGAFSAEGLALMRRLWPRLLEAPESEARRLFACNAHTPDGRHVLIQRGCSETARMLTQHGFAVIEVDTSEYLKSGGSVFCMKMMVY